MLDFGDICIELSNFRAYWDNYCNLDASFLKTKSTSDLSILSAITLLYYW